MESVRIRLFIGAGSDAKEAVFGVDCPQTAILALTQPSDIVADSPDLIALFLIDFRGISIARLVLPQAEGKAAQMYLVSP